MKSDVVADVAASVAAVLAASGLLYARASARATRDATAAARRAAELAAISRRSAARARLRHRVERIGELIQELYFSSLVDPDADSLSQRTRAQCNVLNQAVIGLKDILPRSAEVCLARSPAQLQERTGSAHAEIDKVLAGLADRRPNSRTRGYRGRFNRRVPWHRSTKSSSVGAR